MGIIIAIYALHSTNTYIPCYMQARSIVASYSCLGQVIIVIAVMESVSMAQESSASRIADIDKVTTLLSGLQIRKQQTIH